VSLGSGSTTQTEAGLWRNSGFALLLLGTATSLLGDSLYAIVLSWWILTATGLAKASALVSLVGSIVLITLSPIAGTIADRTDRRRVMIIADISRSLLVGILAVLMWRQQIGIVQLAVMAGFLAAAGAFFTPAYSAAMTGLVHPNDLTAALSIFQLLRQCVLMIGLSVAGVLVSFTGNALALLLDALSFLVSAGAIAMIRLHWAPRPPKKRKPFWGDFRAGLQTIFGNDRLVRILLLSVGVNLAGGTFAVLLPVIGIREMGLSRAQYGLLTSMNPAGLVIGTLILTFLSKYLAHRGVFMLHSLLVMGLINVAMAWAVTPVSFGALLFAAGLAFGLSNVMFATIFRSIIPQDQQGRFFGMYGPLNQVLMPVGLALGGVLGDAMSPFIVAGIVGAAVALLALWGLTARGLRDIK